MKCCKLCLSKGSFVPEAVVIHEDSVLCVLPQAELDFVIAGEKVMACHHRCSGDPVLWFLSFLKTSMMPFWIAPLGICFAIACRPVAAAAMTLGDKTTPMRSAQISLARIAIVAVGLRSYLMCTDR